MMLDWNGYREQVLATVTELARTSPDTVRGYRQLSDAGNKKNLLGAKTRELIALAVAVVTFIAAVAFGRDVHDAIETLITRLP